MTQDLDRLLELAKEATPGPWELEESTAVGGYVIKRGKIIILVPDAEADARYAVAASPDVVRGLIERVKLAEYQAAKMKNPDDWINESLLATERQLEEAEARARVWEEEVATWRANVNTLEARAEHWQREHDRQRADNQVFRDDIVKLNEIVKTADEGAEKAETRLRAAEESERAIQKDMDFLTEVSMPELVARLRAAEEVVDAARHLIGEIPGPHPNPDVEEYREALRHYDEAVGRVKE